MLITSIFALVFISCPSFDNNIRISVNSIEKNKNEFVELTIHRCIKLINLAKKGWRNREIEREREEERVQRTTLTKS